MILQSPVWHSNPCDLSLLPMQHHSRAVSELLCVFVCSNGCLCCMFMHIGVDVWQIEAACACVQQWMSLLNVHAHRCGCVTNRSCVSVCNSTYLCLYVYAHSYGCVTYKTTPLSIVYSFIDQFVESCDCPIKNTSHAKCLSHITSLSAHRLEKARPRNAKQETKNCVLIRDTEHFSVPVLYNLQWPPLRRNFAYS